MSIEKMDANDDGFLCDVVFRDKFSFVVDQFNVYSEDVNLVPVYESGEQSFYEEFTYLNQFIVPIFEV